MHFERGEAFAVGMSDSDDKASQASGSGSEHDSEADARRAARVEMLLANLSDEARKMLYGMHGKLSRLSIVKRMRRVLAKRSACLEPASRLLRVSLAQ